MRTKKPFRITGKHVIGGLLLFFGLIISVNIAFISLANKSFPGETVDNAYDKGVRYNETLAERERAAKLGWEITYSYMEYGEDENQFIVKVVDADGPVDGLNIELALRWAANREADTTLTLIPAGNGLYRTAIQANSLPRALGQFDGQITRLQDGAQMTFSGRL